MHKLPLNMNLESVRKTGSDGMKDEVTMVIKWFERLLEAVFLK